MLAILNAHSFDQIFCPVSYALLRRRPHKKYFQLSKYIRRHGLIYFDFTESSFLGHKRRVNFLPFLILVNLIEIPIWCILNRIPLKNVRLLVGNQRQDTTLIVFTYKFFLNCTQHKITNVKKFKNIYFHLNHYMLDSENKARKIRDLFPDAGLLADSDLSENAFFKSLFPKKKKVKILPFTPQVRFQTNIRKNVKIIKPVVLIGGTIPDLTRGADYKLTEYFRKQLKADNYHHLRSELKSMTDSRFVDLRKKKDSIERLGVMSNMSDADYYPVMFRNARFCCFGDERSGAVAISNLEAMVCGTLPFITGGALHNYPLEENIHYVNCPSEIDQFIDWLGENFQELNNVFERGYEARLMSYDKLSRFVNESVLDLTQ
jgi:hypothetical protein